MSTNKARKWQQWLLKSPIRMDEEQWDFTVANLPKPDKLNKEQLIRNIFICYDRKSKCYCIKLRLERVEPNRAIKNDPLDRFLLVSFGEFTPSRQDSGTKSDSQVPDSSPSCAQDSVIYTIKLLRAGVSINQTKYNFYGYSSSQYKSRTCYLYAAPKEDITAKIEAFGDFRQMKSVGKKVKRIGLLFATTQTACTVDADRCQDIPDIERSGYIFTDGCGLISPHLAHELARLIQIKYRGHRYTPSVMQIRYRGYKGVVTLDPRMQKERALVKMRHSMNKLKGVDDLSFAVVGHSKPYSYGFLNDESIILLYSLGISREILLRKQSEYITLLTDAPTNTEAALELLSSVDRTDLVEKVLMEGLNAAKSEIRQVAQTERRKLVNTRNKRKCRIRVPKSRYIYGVADAWDVLAEGECALTVTLEDTGIAHTIKNTNISVIRNPCLHPGDWRKLLAVERPELKHLKDCIVFSTRGTRPAADMMSGGDLDGDMFTVCWDPDLVPSTESAPAAYPGGEEPPTFGPITDDDRLVYFANFNKSLGKIKNLYVAWAEYSGPMSAECQQLNRLFSHCVDGAPAKIPEALENVPEKKKSSPPFILDELHTQAEKLLDPDTLGDLDGTTPDVDMITALLSRDNIAMSEFDLIQLVYRWCRKTGIYFDYLYEFFDFNVLTPEQRAWVIAAMPVTREAPQLVNNALFSSNLLSAAELTRFQLDHAAVIWKRVYDSSHDRLATFLEATATNMELFHRKLIVFRPDERLTLAMYIPRRVERSLDCAVEDTARLFAFPHSQGTEFQSRLSLPTKSEYICYCDERILQLFNRKRQDSWIYLVHPGSDDSTYRNIKNRGERRRQRQKTVDSGKNFDICASVALNKFNQQLQKHIGLVRRAEVTAAEIYVISNRDHDSMRNLDLWIEMIDTGRTLPIFSQQPKEYSIPGLNDVLAHTSKAISEIIGDKSLLAFKSLKKKGNFLTVFDLLLQLGQDDFLLECYEYLLEHYQELAIGETVLLGLMLEFLEQAPFLVIAFGNVYNGIGLPNNILDVLEKFGQPILKAFILSASDKGYLIMDPLYDVLQAMPDQSISLANFSNLIELIALTVPCLDLAEFLLTEVIEPQSHRLVSGPRGLTSDLTRNLLQIAIEYVTNILEKREQEQEDEKQIVDLKAMSERKDERDIEVAFRIDAPGGTPEKYSHVRLSSATPPKNAPRKSAYSIDALVTASNPGLAKMRCLHPLPPFYQDCSWRVEVSHCFLITKSKFETILKFTSDTNCRISKFIFHSFEDQDNHQAQSLVPDSSWPTNPQISPSQQQAIQMSLNYPLTCVRASPGPMKINTIIEMIRALQQTHPNPRLLVTAATDMSVDKLLAGYLDRIQTEPPHTRGQAPPVRVATNVRRVTEDLRQYTCDALIGEAIGNIYDPPDVAKTHLRGFRIVFTTSIDAGCRFLQDELFTFVIVDEAVDGASAQPEHTSLVPLAKGCVKAIIFGDKTDQLAAEQHSALSSDFHQTLFQRIYTNPVNSQRTNVGIVDIDP